MADQNPKPFSSLKNTIITGSVILVLGTAGALIAYNSLHKQTNPISNNPDIVEPDNPTPPVQIEEGQRVNLYWLNENLEIIPRTTDLPKAQTQEEVLTNAFDTLLQGSDGEDFSAIPENTQLVNLDVKENGVYVDLSSEFTTGGGSASMIGRLGQVIYTASSLNPESPVWLSVNGEPLELLGGEGLEIEQPMTRDLYEQQYGIE
ncbi:GerMN domain-containing protein [Cyanobacterium stanieri LEGE 03274]|uniref:GerMN domain-containing protein n=1 Tax=Cyanobacterium stanieri LEGE 03274 TaxID=1828756 RepID=A0ABR9V857_9CHRO|nr:GerMN domain-containing protein [Cyanobacterium stanieri]MBE9223009.1 GerMN domain-containing protein [Cyanobacterium stanieri LEGE 03274]